ncbi:MAG TPA: GDSL family lipase [Cyanobacteria bacterium UBA8543]|nr:GDSL family lipase [Cyanobacteria bacterium UBA8543]
MNKKVVASGFFLLSFLLPLKAMATNFSQLYVFGDSLSDTGNVFTASRGLVPASPYFDGRFSNGLIWVDYLAQDLGLNPSPNTNFAFGGATTGTNNTISTLLPGLQQQINGFTQANPTADPNGLYVVWAGANDYLGGNVINPTIPITNISNAITSLARVGAQNILVLNLGDLGSLPGTRTDPQQSANLSLLSNAHNSGLSQAIAALSPQLGSSVNLTLIDTNSLFNRVYANPAEFNFTNVTTACLSVLSCASANQNAQNQYLFWDSIHPTTAGHQLIADVAFSSLNSTQPTGVPEPGSTLGVLAFGALGAGLKLKRKKQKNVKPVKNR